jgi:hypothetical protein
VTRRRTWLLVVGVLVGLSAASPAAADPAGPTHYDSRLTGVEPADAPVSFEILGGDAFLVVRAAPGTEVEVPGYGDEPYVRIAPDGTVEVNQRSPSRWENDARYGAAELEVPADADVEAPPRWEVVASEGEYAWHDHRIHWMSPSLPRQVDPAAGTPQPVADWAVPLLVDGEEVTVTGELLWLPGPSPAVPVGVVLLAVAAGMALGWTRPGWVPAVLGVGGLLTLATGVSKNLGLPPGADGEPFLVVLPVLALGVVAAGVGLVRRAGGGAVRGRSIAAAGGVPLLVWAVLQAGALTRPVVPGALPVGAVRVVLALAIAAGIAGLLVAARTALAATALDAQGAAAGS